MPLAAGRGFDAHPSLRRAGAGRHGGLDALARRHAADAGWLATSGRSRLAAAAAVASAWIVGAFYYQLARPLATKAAVLCGAGALLAGLAAWARAGEPREAAPSSADSQPRWARWGIALSLLAIVATASLGIREKEALIRDGQPVFVELAPVDPRSLMQGDFMRLNFNVPGEPAERRAGMLRRERPFVVARRDERGVARLLRIADGAALAEGEMRIELTPKDGRWILVSDARFFAEGEAARWEKAKYGEFRVTPDGRALLVGLRGPALEPL
ncbi:GDYXXLXY domain-containing protein [Piscinibacter aquaticus]|uniref:GDYXXLXY domain-containing protein n=1 Tax=Piscinibacter aquaticus TaxID=392597 RepID=A0A5C6TZW0_9BURK|nr:GDYXXLXY domain-containing protein [Piscinibacter aquaticus]